MIDGIDVSKWQGLINWVSVDVKWAVARASLGHTYIDSQYRNNSRGMRDHGILRGAYHVLTPNMGTADEIRNFESALNKGPDPDFLVLDVELDKGQSNQVIRTRVYDMLIEMENLGYKNKVFIYTAAWFWNPHLGGNALSSADYKPLPKDWVLWLADYGANDGTLPARMPILPIGWDEWYVWQYTSKGKVEGIDASVDLNIMKDSYFRQLGGEVEDPSPPPDDEVELRVFELEKWRGKVKAHSELFPV